VGFFISFTCLLIYLFTSYSSLFHVYQVIEHYTRAFCFRYFTHLIEDEVENDWNIQMGETYINFYRKFLSSSSFSSSFLLFLCLLANHTIAHPQVRVLSSQPYYEEMKEDIFDTYNEQIMSLLILKYYSCFIKSMYTHFWEDFSSFFSSFFSSYTYIY
jgi:hypothetical protein